MYKAALIDLDGTLVDTLGDFQWALDAMLNDLGAGPVSRAFIARTVGKGSEHLVRQTLAHAELEPHLYAQAWSRYQHHYDNINGQASRLYPGVLEGLKALQARGWPLVCVTNKPRQHALVLLEKMRIGSFFQACWGGDSCARKKPDPMPLVSACQALNVLPSEVLMIGDSINDAQAARAAGCAVVLLRYGYNHGEPLPEALVDGVLDDLMHLEAWLATP